MRKAERGERRYGGHGGHEHPGDGVRSKAHAQILHPVSRVRNVQMNCNELQRKGLFGSSEFAAAPAIRHVPIRNETTHTKRDPARAGLCCNECEEPAALRAAAHDFAVCWNRAESPISVNEGLPAGVRVSTVSTHTSPDYYEILQISSNAEPETIHRVYRLLAQRYHPDNQETGNEERFRELSEAYQVLGDPERRARYDVVHGRIRQERWRFVSTGNEAENDFEHQQLVRLTVLEVLYTRRRTEPYNPGLSSLDMESLTGIAREHLEFIYWYLVQKKFIVRGDSAMLTITADGADYLENNYRETLQRRRLNPGAPVKV